MAEMQQSNNVKYPDVLSGPPDQNEVLAGYQEKVLIPESSGHGTECPGQWAQPRAAGAQGALNNALTHQVWVLGGPAWSQKLDSMILPTRDTL